MARRGVALAALLVVLLQGVGASAEEPSPLPVPAPEEPVAPAPDPAPAPEPDAAAGACTQDALRARVDVYAGHFETCYRRALVRRRAIWGRVELRWTIENDGRVSGVRSEHDTVHDASLVRCIMNAVRNIRFGRPGDGICIVDWPFDFAPR